MASLPPLWHHSLRPMAWISGLAGAGVAAVTVDSVAVAIVVGCTAIAIGLAKMTPALGAVIREVGFAMADVRGRMAESDRKIEANADLIARNKQDLEVAREKLAAVEKENSEKRHVLANEVQRHRLHITTLKTTLDEAHAEIDRLRRQLGATGQAHAQAINTVADSVEMIAVHMDPPLAVEIPHVGPTPADSAPPTSP